MATFERMAYGQSLQEARNAKLTKIRKGDLAPIGPHEQPQYRIPSEDEVESFRKFHQITVVGKNLTRPFLDFEDKELPYHICRALKRLGFVKPTPVQSECLPAILSGRDTVAIAKNGAGKTLAFALPALTHCSVGSTYDNPKCLILTPTMELSNQIDLVIKKIKFLRTLCIHGGDVVELQRQLLTDVNPQLIIATPGRLKFLTQLCVTELSKVKYLILDEADRLISSNFQNDLRYLLKMMSRDVQKVFVSATWLEQTQELAKDFLQDYIFINVASIKLAAPETIKQQITFCHEKDKYRNLVNLIERLEYSDPSGLRRILIFFNTKQRAVSTMWKLKKLGKRVQPYYSDAKPANREYVLRAFAKGRFPILCATDIASRGIDIKDIKDVINYDYPLTIENYVHRIGRTGRNNMPGTSHTFFTECDKQYARNLMEVLENSGQEVPNELIEYADKSYEEQQN